MLSTEEINTMKSFSSDPKKYVRDFDPFKEAKKNYAFYIWKKTKNKGHTYEEVSAWVDKEWVVGGKLGYKSIPTKVVFYDETKGGDRDFLITTYEDYLAKIRKEKLIISPSGTAFYNQHKKLSPLNGYLDKKKKLRSQDKAKEFEAEMRKDHAAQVIYSTSQKGRKTSINALSGTESLANNSIYAESIHPVLTSFCRTGTSHANAINERFIVGNRHYWHPFVVKANIIALAQNCDKNTVMDLLSKYGIVVPTVDQVMCCIDRCTKAYYRDDDERQSILELVSVLEDHERAYFCYHMDLYTLEVLNPKVVETIFRSLTTKSVPSETVEEAEANIKYLDDDATIAVGIICASETRGVQRKEWKTNDTEKYKIIGGCAGNFGRVTDYYEPFISYFWANELMPASIYELPNIRRKCVLGGDTDSTLYSLWYWQNRYSPEVLFSEETRSISSVITFFSGSIIAHTLRQMSRNAGCVDEYLNVFTMKNEFFFPSFLLTGRAKHYAANQEIKEGNFLPQMDLEVKGVHMRNSAWPIFIKRDVKELTQYILSLIHI